MAQGTGTEAFGGSGHDHSAKALIESDRVEGTAVYGSDNSRIGTVKRLMIDKVSGQVAYAEMSFGGFFGMGEETYTIPWRKLDFDTDLGGYKTDISPESLKGAPDFYRGQGYEWRDRNHERQLHDYYGVSPYWGL